MDRRRISPARSSFVLFLFFSLLITAIAMSTPAKADLWAGAAKLTITPPECSVGGPCPGYSLSGAANGRFSTGVHDDIWVRALVMSSDEDTVILVTIDVLGHFPDRIRGLELTDKFRSQSIWFGTQIFTERVSSRPFTVVSDSTTVKADSVIVATSVMARKLSFSR